MTVTYPEPAVIPASSDDVIVVLPLFARPDFIIAPPEYPPTITIMESAPVPFHVTERLLEREIVAFGAGAVTVVCTQEMEIKKLLILLLS